ncbi:NitT/TauT family transport system substrate-binding protein [Amycolatopsis xylanica]|uniref:NitT/TauT family transport system substrate-binding protein n=1 Tax=Amycolatopsis xylanica TaxID=589385 RepID=A0A1H3TAT5_9PSEU|nr:ABC transporter substrate-binding protein [Amycolatopsis xylanica]SDZ47413.1 NitT/TauT family transport system substrate-binding protein [Amycolatopsis xylanica]
MKTLRALLCGVLLAGCTANAESPSVVNLVIGYQSKTINTVTAGTLLRSLGYLEKRLTELGKRDGKTYKVTWQDYSTGAPITAQMVAGKIDIGSMGDYPMLINGSRTQEFGDGRTKLIAATGYNLLGALNMVVVPKDSPAHELKDLRGKKISASVGSAGHGTTVHALRDAGIGTGDVHIQNQAPAVGASGLQSGAVDALGQFVAWPGQLVFGGQARLLYDGSALKLPTWHGVVVREAYPHREVITEFLRAQRDATDYLHQHPMEAAEKVATATKLPAEVVYLYNGPGGMVTFDLPLKQPLIDALRTDAPFLKSIGNIKRLDLDAFVDDSYLREVYGPAYNASSLDNPAPITGTDPVCGTPVTDPRLAGEVWVRGASVQPSANPDCLLKAIRGKQIRAAYVPDAVTGTRWFADKAYWVRDGRHLPFTTESAAKSYVAAHPGSTLISYAQAVEESR